MPPQQRRYNADGECPICLQEGNQRRCAVETNCGHVYCGECLVELWRHRPDLPPIDCPVCRRRVTMILPIFGNNERNADPGRRILDEVGEYNRRFAEEPRPIRENIYDLPTLLRHVAREFFSLRGIRLAIILYTVFAFFYLVSPIDLIPEIILGPLGLVDDIIVILYFAIRVTNMYRRAVVGMRLN